MSEQNSVTLDPRKHDKLGIIHVGVTREGFISVAGDTANIEDKGSIVFDRSRVKVERTGSKYTFTKM